MGRESHQITNGVPNELILLEKAGEVLDLMSVQETVEFRHRTDAIQTYVRSARLSLEVQNRVTILRIRAERRVGKILSEMKLRGGDRTHSTKRPTALEAMGIDRMQSQRWQRLARISDDELECFFRKVQEEEREVTTASLLRLGKECHSNPRPSKKGTTSLPTGSTTILVCEPLQLLEELHEHSQLVWKMLQPLCEGKETVLQQCEKRALKRYLGEIERIASTVQESLLKKQ